MPDVFITIDASSVYSADAPTLNILVDGDIVSSIVINSAYSTTTYLIPFSGSKPGTFSLQFNDASGEGGRSITLDSVRVNGQEVNANLTLLTLNHLQSSSLNTTATDYLFGRITPSNAEMGTPTISGTNGNENIDGTEDDDIIRGLNGNDKILAGAGNDRIIGDGGLDHIFGEDGNDIIQSGIGNDRIIGGAGDDLIYSHNDNDYVTGDDGNDTINLGAGHDRGYGGADDDIILGGAGNDLIYGDDGNDVIEGQNDNDKLYGGAGNDDISGGEGFDALYGEAGDDLLNGGTENDLIYGGDDNDALRGSDGDDKLYGDNGNDDIRGGNDADWLTGGSGIDNLRGDAGDDLLFYDPQDSFWGGTGFDWLVMTQFDASDIDFSSTNIKDGIEGVTLINWNNGAQANEISLNRADIIANSDLDYLFIAGDAGLDSVVSADYTIADRVLGGNVSRGGHQYALFDDSGTDLYIEIGLTLNGNLIV